MKYLIPALSALLLAGTALSSGASAQPAQTCLRQNMVNGWKVVDDQTLIVSDPLGRRYTVSLAKGCHDLKWPMHLGFSAGTGFGISCLGRHDFVTVPANGGSVSQRCLINDVQPYMPGALHAAAGATAMNSAH